jgi:hypothetical protein
LQALIIKMVVSYLYDSSEIEEGGCMQHGDGRPEAGDERWEEARRRDAKRTLLDA